MKFLLPLLLLSALAVSGCSIQTPDEVETPAPRVATTQTPLPTPSATVAPAPVVAAPAPAPAPAAPAYVDYVTPVISRWGACFARLGVGDIYYDSLSSTVTGAWNNGVLTWSVGHDNMYGSPADQQSVDALSGC
ncbi:MAG: hypothetical protein ABL886_12860 [Rhodoglobus sp.]